MPPWFIDIESATEIEAKSNGTPPAARTAAAVSRAKSPSSALQGVTRPSVEAMPTNGLPKSSSFTPSARRNARCGARSRPSVVILERSFFVFTHDLFDGLAARQAELLRPLRRGAPGRRIHQLLDERVGLEAHAPARARLDRLPHLLRARRGTAEKHRAPRAE